MAANARVWIVTGASRGIGATIAAVAAKSGHHVALIARGESVVGVADGLGESASGWQCDVANSESAVSYTHLRGPRD